MKLFCRVAKEAVEVEPTKASKETWRERGGRIVLMEHVSGSEDEEARNEAQPGEVDVEIEVCRDGD